MIVSKRIALVALAALLSGCVESKDFYPQPNVLNLMERSGWYTMRIRDQGGYPAWKMLNHGQCCVTLESYPEGSYRIFVRLRLDEVSGAEVETLNAFFEAIDQPMRIREEMWILGQFVYHENVDFRDLSDLRGHMDDVFDKLYRVRAAIKHIQYRYEEPSA